MDEFAQSIALAVHRTRMATDIVNRKTPARGAAAQAALRLAAIDIAATLGHDNPEFDRGTFLAVCGLTAFYI